MAVGVLIAVPGGNQELYEQVNEAMGIDPSNAEVEGLIIHSAGPMEGGWYVYDIWETREHFERFSRARLAPAVEQVTGQPASGEPEFYEVASLIFPRQAVS